MNDNKDIIFELNHNSPKIENLDDLNITLKEHQLRMIHKCIKIEDNNLTNFGIMSDKPGTGKTYALLGLIYKSEKKNNLIVIPQNLLNQWINSIHQFSDGLLSYKKIVCYNDILNLYDDNNQDDLNNYDILITTSLFYHSLATTLNSKYLHFSRVIFDEIDSISNVIMYKINSDFTWLVSASFNIEDTGSFIIDNNNLPYITCKCDDNYVDEIFEMDKYNVYSIICKNIYLDNIFTNILDNDEYNLLNALDYSKLKQKFQYKIANNDIEAVKYLICDKKDIIEIEKIRIEDLKKSILCTTDKEKIKNYNVQMENAEKSLNENSHKLNLIMERLKENNCCPSCYNEFEDKKKVLSPCCQNIICFDCTNNWFNKMHKNNCIYCNSENISFNSYILIKNEVDNLCNVCDKSYSFKQTDSSDNSIDDVNSIDNNNDDNNKIDNENNDEKKLINYNEKDLKANKLYSHCCNKSACKNCVQDWFLRLFKKECIFCHDKSILYEDFKTEKEHEDVLINLKKGIKYTKYSKQEFLKYFIVSKINSKSKIIFCSQYPKIFKILIDLLIEYKISFVELDNGNINEIYESINNYIYGNHTVLLLNSNLYGCGLDLQITSDIVFLHKTSNSLKKQIIGRAQRPNRKKILNIWHIMHENEHIIDTKKEISNNHYKIEKKKEIKNDIFTDNLLDNVSNYTLL